MRYEINQIEQRIDKEFALTRGSAGKRREIAIAVVNELCEVAAILDAGGQQRTSQDFYKDARDRYEHPHIEAG